MDRYIYSTKTMGRYETVRMVKPEIRPTDTYIFSREGDRFDQLAQEFYNDVTLWWFIKELT